MADKDKNDGYEFKDMDDLESMYGDFEPDDAKEDQEDEADGADVFAPQQSEPRTMPDPDESSTQIKKKALLVVGLFVLALVGYRFYSGLVSTDAPTKPLTITNNQKPVEPVIEPKPVVPVVVPDAKVAEPKIEEHSKKLSDLERNMNALQITQQSVRSDVDDLKNQLSTINSNMSSISQQLSEISQQMANLENQLQMQASQLRAVQYRAKAKPKPPVASRPSMPKITWQLQAVIPGRAWLIASNGSTLTVREGSSLSGYGIVKIIDAIQGRVLTSSGKVIQFAQNDS